MSIDELRCVRTQVADCLCDIVWGAYTPDRRKRPPEAGVFGVIREIPIIDRRAYSNSVDSNATTTEFDPQYRGEMT
jgi:hypothetical protein